MSLKKCCVFKKKDVNLKKNTNQDWCRFKVVDIIVSVESIYGNNQSHPKSMNFFVNVVSYNALT